jgi:O-antigen/teichoic acid export membrane protein
MINFLGSEIYGIISFAGALSATFNVFADLGFGSAHIKRISEGKAIDDCVSTYAVVKIVLTFVTVGVSIIAITFWVFFLGGNLTGVTVNLVLLFILYQVFYNLSGIATQTYYAKMEQTKAQIISLSDPLIRVPLIAIVVLGGMGAIEVAYAYVLSALSILVIGFLFLRRDRIKWGRPALFSSYLSFALPLIIISIIGTVASNMDKLLLGFFWDYNSVGYYSASLAFTGLFGTWERRSPS